MASRAKWVSPPPVLDLPHGAHLQAYSANQNESSETALDNINVELAVLALMQANSTAPLKPRLPPPLTVRAVRRLGSSVSV